MQCLVSAEHRQPPRRAGVPAIKERQSIELGRPRSSRNSIEHGTSMRPAKTTADTVASKRAGILPLPRPRRSAQSGTMTLDGEGVDRLRRRYSRLYKRYIEAVQKGWMTSERRLATLQLGWWALDRTHAAPPPVRGRKITLCNPRFHELHRDGEPRAWRRMDSTHTEGP